MAYDRDDEDDPFRRRRAVLELLEGPRDDDEDEEQTPEVQEAYGDDLERARDVVGSMPNASQIEQKAAVRQQVQTEAGELASWVRINPFSVNRGTIGGQQKVLAGGPNTLVEVSTAAQQALQTAMWPGDDIETTNVIVTLAPVEQIFLVDKAAPRSFRPVALLQFGCRGFLVNAEIDIAKGCQFSIGASFVSLQVSLPLGPGLVSGVDSMKLSGMLSFGKVEHQPEVTRTRYIDNLAISPASETVTVPPFAKNVIVQRQSIIGSTTILAFKDAGGVIRYIYQIAPGATMFEPLRVMPDIQSITVVDSTGQGYIALQFGLAF